MTVTVGTVLGKIVKYSEKLPSLLGYSRTEFEYLHDIKDLMPITLGRVHDDMMTTMMIGNTTSILHNKRQVFLVSKNNFLLRAEVFLDINQAYPEEMPF